MKPSNAYAVSISSAPWICPHVAAPTARSARTSRIDTRGPPRCPCRAPSSSVSPSASFGPRTTQRFVSTARIRFPAIPRAACRIVTPERRGERCVRIQAAIRIIASSTRSAVACFATPSPSACARSACRATTSPHGARSATGRLATSPESSRSTCRKRPPPRSRNRPLSKRSCCCVVSSAVRSFWSEFYCASSRPPSKRHSDSPCTPKR